MNYGEVEVKVMLAGNPAHDIDHPGEPGIGPRRAG
jgi:hypothetical protein